LSLTHNLPPNINQNFLPHTSGQMRLPINGLLHDIVNQPVTIGKIKGARLDYSPARKVILAIFPALHPALSPYDLSKARITFRHIEGRACATSSTPQHRRRH
jgi:hypothetical protein